MELLKIKFFLTGLIFTLFNMFCVAQNTNQSIQEVERLHQLGTESATQKGGWLAALSYYGDALRLSKEIKYLKGEADILRSIADLESKAPYRNDEALEYLLMELRVRQQIGDPLEIAKTYIFIGEFFQERFHLHDEAIAYFRQAITIMQVTQKQANDLIISTWQKIADAYAFVEDMPSYFAANDSLLDFYKSIDELEKASELSMEVSKQQAELKNLEQSLEYAEKGKRYYSLYAVESNHEQNQNLKEFDNYLSTLQQKKQDNEQKQKNRRSWMLLAVLIPVLFIAALIWLNLYKKSRNK